MRKECCIAWSKGFLVGAIGMDSAGDEIEIIAQSYMENSPLLIYCDFVKDMSVVTTRKTRLIDTSGRQLFRIDTERKHELDAGAQIKIAGTISKYVPLVDAIVISDYNKGLIT